MPDPLTTAQQALVDERRRLIRRILHERLRFWGYGRIVEGEGRQTVGGQTHNRQLGFGKLAIFEDGRYLLSHWYDIETELLQPPELVAFNMRGVSAGVRGTILLAWSGADFESRFYRTVKSGPTVESFGGWSCTRVDTIPGFGAVSREDVWEWLGLIGGTDPGLESAASAPGAPTAFAAEAVAGLNVRLTWEAPADIGRSAITGYRIEVAEGEGKEPDLAFAELVANTRSTSALYVHLGVRADVHYSYRISAINAQGTGPPAGMIAMVIPSAPTP